MPLARVLADPVAYFLSRRLGISATEHLSSAQHSPTASEMAFADRSSRSPTNTAPPSLTKTAGFSNGAATPRTDVCSESTSTVNLEGSSVSLAATATGPTNSATTSADKRCGSGACLRDRTKDLVRMASGLGSMPSQKAKYLMAAEAWRRRRPSAISRCRQRFWTTKK